MKKISILLLVSLCSFVSFGQFTNKQVVANGKTLFVSAGAIKGDSGVVIPSFNDTSLANSVQIKNTAGILIKSKDTLYLRADCLCKWVAVGTSTTIKPDSFKMMYPMQVYDSGGLTRVRIAYSWQDSALAMGGGDTTYLSLRINDKKDKSDTVSSIGYVRNWQNANNVKYTDTAMMLDAYKNFWSKEGNYNTDPNVNFLGTKDNAPLYLLVNGDTIARFFPNGGVALNYADGQSNQSTGFNSFSTGSYNIAEGNLSANLGGINNIIHGESSVTLGGFENKIFGKYCIAAGTSNILYSYSSYVLGNHNISKNEGSTIIGLFNDTTNTNDLFTVGNGNAGTEVRNNAFQVLQNGKTLINNSTSDSILNVNGGIQFKGIYPSTNSTDSMLVKNSDGGVGLRAIPSGSIAKFTTNGYGTIVDSTSNLYTIKADTNTTAKLRDAAISSKLNITDAATTYYPLTGGSYLSAINGTGYLGLTAQTTQPTAPTTGLVKLYANATGRLSWLTSLGFARTINSRPLTADRTYTFYDRDYTVADSADVSGKQATLVSGTNIKTVNGNTLLGSGDVSVGTVTSVAALTLGTTGTDLSSTVATGTTTPVITLNVPSASATARGVITTGTQTIAGAKTFNNSMTVNGNVTSSSSGGVATFPLFQNTAPLLTSYTSAWATSGTISTAITGSKRTFYDNTSFAPTTGTARLSSYEDNRTINQTGTATGTIAGIYINPTLTSAVDYRAIEVVNGSVVLPYRAVSTTTTIAQNNYTIDCTSGTFTLTLPTAVGMGGKIFVVKNSGTGVITLTTTSSQTIDGSTTKTLSSQYSGYQLQSDNANWKIIAIF